MRCIVNIATLLSFAFIGLSFSLTALGEEDTHADQEVSTKRKVVRVEPTIPLPDARGEVDLVVCSQNLKLFGEYNAVASRVGGGRGVYDDKVLALSRRFAAVHCDIVAVQELVGKSQESLENGLKVLATKLKQLTNRSYEVSAGVPAEGGMAQGFLVATDRAEVINTVAYSSVELPKLTAKQKPRLFTRSPLELQLSVSSRDGGARKTVTIVNFHFKSKRGAAGDPSGLEWETYRMEMSEALRRIVERRLKGAFASGESLLLLVGDRNSNFDVASARILEGTLSLKSFQETAPCRLTKRGAPICKAGETHPQRLFSVFTTNPKTKSLPGTFKYKDEYSWLDDILMPSESLPFAWVDPASQGVFDAGVLYDQPEASDHAMVYVNLNW